MVAHPVARAAVCFGPWPVLGLSAGVPGCGLLCCLEGFLGARGVVVARLVPARHGGCGWLVVVGNMWPRVLLDFFRGRTGVGVIRQEWGECIL